jgi:tetratricopeptide (TPR) repeat protein
VRGQAADARSDVWAVGVVLYEMLAGHVPFQGSHAEAIAHAIRNEAPTPLRASRPDVPEEIEQLVFRALHKDQTIRFQSGRQLSRALRDVRGVSIPVDLRTDIVVSPSPSKELAQTRMRWLRRSLAAVLVAAIATPVAWWFRPIPRIPSAIAPVANVTGDMSLEPYRLALTHTLERSLSESRYARVIAHGKLVQVLRRFLSDGSDVSSRDVIHALGQHAGAAVIIVPSLVFDDGSLRARAEFLHPMTATPSHEPVVTEPVTSALTKGSADELMDTLAAAIDERFRNSHWLAPRHPMPKARFRTLDAARALEEGVTAYEEGELDAARTAFELAAREAPNHPLPAAWLSRVARVLGDRDSAEQAAATAARLIDAATLPSDRIFVTAVTAEARRDRATALERYEALVDMFPDDPAWLMERAAFTDREGDTAAAVALYHDVLAKDAGLARAHLQLCRLYNSTRMNEAELARKHGELARAAYVSLGAVSGEAQALLCLVDILRVGDASQRAEARVFAARASTIFNSLVWPFNQARAYHYAAMAAQRDDLAKAAALWEIALTRARSVRYGALEAAVLTNLGGIYHEMGDRARAAKYYAESFRLNETRGDERGAASSQANAGALMIQSGANPELGRRHLLTALMVFIRLQDRNFEMYCRKNLAEYYRHVGDYNGAERELNLAETIASQYGFKDDAPDLALERARLRLAVGDYIGAREAFQRALRYGAGPIGEMRLGLGRVQTLLGDFDGARSTLASVAADLASGGREDLRRQLSVTLGILAYESNHVADAAREFRRATLGGVDVQDPEVAEAFGYAGLLDALDGRRAVGYSAVQRCIADARRMRRVSLEFMCRVHLARMDLVAGSSRGAGEIFAGPDSGALSPEVQASVHYWKARVHELRGEATQARSEDQAARKIVTKLLASVPSANQSGFRSRPEIRRILG